MKYIFDTNAVINFVCNEGDFSFLTIKDNFLISFVTAIELSVGFKNKDEEEIIKKFTDQLDLILIDRELISKTVDIRKKYGLKIPDAIITATAISEHAVLITSDKEIIQKISASQIEIIDPNK